MPPTLSKHRRWVFTDFVGWCEAITDEHPHHVRELQHIPDACFGPCLLETLEEWADGAVTHHVDNRVMKYAVKHKFEDVLKFMWDETTAEKLYRPPFDHHASFYDIGETFYRMVKEKVKKHIAHRLGEGKEEDEGFGINDLIGGPGRPSWEKKGALEDETRRCTHSISFDFGSGIADDEGFVNVVFVFVRAETGGELYWGGSCVIKVPARWREIDEKLFFNIPKGANMPVPLPADLYERTIRHTAEEKFDCPLVFASSER